MRREDVTRVAWGTMQPPTSKLPSMNNSRSSCWWLSFQQVSSSSSRPHCWEILKAAICRFPTLKYHFFLTSIYIIPWLAARMTPLTLTQRPQLAWCRKIKCQSPAQHLSHCLATISSLSLLLWHHFLVSKPLALWTYNVRWLREGSKEGIQNVGV